MDKKVVEKIVSFLSLLVLSIVIEEVAIGVRLGCGPLSAACNVSVIVNICGLRISLVLKLTFS